MKKVLVLLLSLVLAASLFAGCGKKDSGNKTEPTPAPTTAPKSEDKNAGDSTEAKSAKTGLGVVTSLAKSANPGEKEGLAEVGSTVAAVLVGQDGKILKCEIDVAQTKINFSAEGKVTTDLAKEFKTKQELKEEYGMKARSGIGKEWYEQANAFAEYVVGKTLDEVKGIAVAEGYPADEDLKASVTMHITEMIGAVEKAVNNAQDLGAKDTDKLGLAVSTSISGSKDATADAEGLAQAYSHYAVVTTDADGKITSSAIDASQGKVNFSTAGVISTDLTAAVKSKQELKDDYGMKARSGIGKEWYEQANSFAQYVTGKTAAEVKGIAVSEGYPADADLKASVTVHVTDMITVVDKAVANAK